MARPLKEGVDYYPTDVNIFNDFKIIKLLDRYGPLGYTIYSWIVCKVYANGYYLKYDPETFPLIIKKEIGGHWIKSEQVVIQVMHFCAEIGLFDDDLMQSEHIITSVGIQKRFKEITVRRRQNRIEKYCILDDAVLKEHENEVNVVNNRIIDNNNEINVGNNSIKVKESINTCSEQDLNKQGIAILLKDGSEYIIIESAIEDYKKIYKNIDVYNECEKMRLWCESNPRKRKTRRGVLKFINGWLSRAEENIKEKKGVKRIEYPRL